MFVFKVVHTELYHESKPSSAWYCINKVERDGPCLNQHHRDYILTSACFVCL